MKTAAIILAGGFSSRMGSDKALLDLGGQPVIERIVSSYQAAGIERIIVVTGQNHAALAQLCLPVVLVQNPMPEQGMFSSIQTGVAALEPAVDAFFVQPVDIPLVSSVTLSNLMAALQQNSVVDVVIPVFRCKRGHPPLLRRQQLAGAILAYNGTDGLRGLISRYAVVEIPVNDQGVLLGMNTPQQYEELQRYLANILF